MITKHCYVVLFRGKSYRVVLGHLDEFISLMQPLDNDSVVVESFCWTKFKNKLEWYQRV